MIHTFELRRRMLAGEELTGVLLRAPAEELVEIIAASGIDFILLDGEHGPLDTAQVRRHIAAAALFGVEVLVRIGEGDRSDILRVLDAGASGIVIPHLEEPAQAAAIATAATFPPRGTRGLALYSRAASYGRLSAEEYKQAAAANILVVGMIESPQAVARAGEILDQPGIDAYLVGTSDLGASRQDTDPPMAELLGSVHQQAATLGKARLDIVSTLAEANAARANGATAVVINVTALITDTLQGFMTKEATVEPA